MAKNVYKKSTRNAISSKVLGCCLVIYTQAHTSTSSSKMECKQIK